MSHHFEFIWALVRRDLQSRYLSTLWGAAWLLIHPAIQILIYIVIFSAVLGARIPGVTDSMGYGIYLCAGLLPWTFFSELMTRFQTLFLDYRGLLKKIRFPQLTLPLTLLISTGITFGIVFVLFALFLWVSGRNPGWPLISLLPLTGLLMLLGLGLGMLTGTLNIFFRDVGQTVTVVMQFWFWLTPIVYPFSALPEGYRDYMALNPMVGLLAGFQRVCLYGEWPQLQPLIYPGLLTAGLCAAALFLYRQMQPDLLDEL